MNLKKWLEDVPDDTPFVPEGDLENCILDVQMYVHNDPNNQNDPNWSKLQEQMSICLVQP